MGHCSINRCLGNNPGQPADAIPVALARPSGLPLTREAAKSGGPATITNAGPQPHSLNLTRAVNRGIEKRKAADANTRSLFHADPVFFFQNKLDST